MLDTACAPAQEPDPSPHHAVFTPLIHTMFGLCPRAGAGPLPAAASGARPVAGAAHAPAPARAAPHPPPRGTLPGRGHGRPTRPAMCVSLSLPPRPFLQLLQLPAYSQLLLSVVLHTSNQPLARCTALCLLQGEEPGALIIEVAAWVAVAQSWVLVPFLGLYNITHGLPVMAPCPI